MNYPDDWTEIPLLDYVQLVQGLTYTPENVKPFGTLVLRSSNIKNGFLSLKDNVYVDCQIPDEKLIQCGDILICVRNGSPSLIGKSCVLKKMPRTTFGAFMSILRGDKTGYISKLWGHDIIQRQVRGNSSATINQITKKDFKNIIIPIPTTQTEQTAIATALSDMDSLIDSLRQLIAKKRNIRQGAMQEILTGKRRLPGFERKWEEVLISKCGSFVSGNGFPLIYQGREEGKYPFFKVSDFNNIGNEYFMCKSNNYISDEVARKLSCNLIPERAIILAKIGAAIFLERKKMTRCVSCIDNNMMAFLPNQNVHNEFIWLVFQTLIFGSYVQTTALPSLSGKNIGKWRICIPSEKKEQQAISQVILDMYEEIRSLESKLQKYENIKKGMMEKLLTGQIRLV